MDRNTKIIVGIAVAAAVAFWLRNSLKESAANDTRAVTTSRAGGELGVGVTTTPIKTAAYATARTTLDKLRKAFGGASENPGIPSKNARVPANAKLTAYGSKDLARAAYKSPVQSVAANYRPSSYSPLKA